jgi:glycosyltransferase involved in cell wall biosynthesis
VKTMVKSAIIATHSTEVFGPPFALANYLKDAGWKVVLIDHPLDFDPARRSHVSCWQGHELVFEKYYPNWMANRPVNYLKDLFVTIWTLLWSGRRHVDLFIGCDSLALLAAIMVRPLAAIKRLIAYNTDYSTTRFDSTFLNNIYLWADRFAMARVDTIWCVTQRIVRIRQAERPDPASVLHVPNGAYLLDNQKTRKLENQTLVFIGNLTREKGIEELLQALTGTPNVRLTIYGGGGEQAAFIALAKKLKLSNRVTFAGQVSSEELAKTLPEFTAGVALYQPSQSYVHFSDPLKVKEYLAAGLPVIMTDVPEIAETIKKEKAGVVIAQPSQLNEAIKAVIANHESMSKQACRLSKRFEWGIIFDEAIEHSEKDPSS